MRGMAIAAMAATAIRRAGRRLRPGPPGGGPPVGSVVLRKRMDGPFRAALYGGFLREGPRGEERASAGLG
ncbi:hypothetical protein GCM10027160_32890 [Streptomyces calidiresistens]